MRVRTSNNRRCSRSPRQRSSNTSRRPEPHGEQARDRQRLLSCHLPPRRHDHLPVAERPAVAARLEDESRRTRTGRRQALSRHDCDEISKRSPRPPASTAPPALERSSRFTRVGCRETRNTLAPVTRRGSSRRGRGRAGRRAGELHRGWKRSPGKSAEGERPPRRRVPRGVDRDRTHRTRSGSRLCGRNLTLREGAVSSGAPVVRLRCSAGRLAASVPAAPPASVTPGSTGRHPADLGAAGTNRTGRHEPRKRPLPGTALREPAAGAADETPGHGVETTPEGTRTRALRPRALRCGPLQVRRGSRCRAVRRSGVHTWRARCQRVDRGAKL